MNAQLPVVALVVAACAVYAAWALAPRSLRRRVAEALRGRSWPAPIDRFLERHARADDGCGCDGCEVGEAKRKAAPKAPGAAQPITFHPRPPR